MAFPQYKEVLELTDEEVTDIINIVYNGELGSDEEDAPYIEEISRNPRNKTIYVRARSAYELFEDEIEEDTRYGWAEDNFELNDEEGLVSYDFSLGDYAWKVQQKLLSLGCNLLLKDNEFLA